MLRRIRAGHHVELPPAGRARRAGRPPFAPWARPTAPTPSRSSCPAIASSAATGGSWATAAGWSARSGCWPTKAPSRPRCGDAPLTTPGSPRPSPRRLSSSMDTLRHDVALAIRSLLRDRAFSLAAVATLALGVGAITTLAAVVAGVLLAPLPYRQPDRLVAILHGRSVSSPVSPADFDDIRRATRSFSGDGRRAGVGRQPHRRWAHRARAGAAGDGHAVRRARRCPAARPHDCRTPTSPAMHASSCSPTGCGSAALAATSPWSGAPVVINGESYRVIGVMPPAFRFAPFWQTKAEAWVPLSLADRATDRGGRSLRVFARLRDGVSLDQARAELAASTTVWRATGPTPTRG